MTPKRSRPVWCDVCGAELETFDVYRSTDGETVDCGTELDCPRAHTHTREENERSDFPMSGDWV